MKEMSCRQLGGGCDEIFRASTFEEISLMSKNHGINMLKKGDPAHRTAMEKMKSLMADPRAMAAWMEEKRRDFENLPEFL